MSEALSNEQNTQTELKYVVRNKRKGDLTQFAAEGALHEDKNRNILQGIKLQPLMGFVGLQSVSCYLVHLTTGYSLHVPASSMFLRDL